MAEEKELERLEGFVATLLEKFNKLRADHKELTERLKRRDTKIENLQEELTSMKNDQSEVSNRVNSLIGQIEEWELSNSDESEQTALYDDAEQAESRDNVVREERIDSAIQGNLFSTENTSE